MNGEHKLTTADINQLAGRGNRSQSIPEALLIAINPAYGVDALSIIQKNDEGGEVNQVPENVKRLYDRWHSLAKHSEKRERIIAVLKNEGWMKEEWPLTTDDHRWLYGVTDSFKKK